MLKFFFGIALILVGFGGALFVDPIWGIYLYAALSHIRLEQLGETVHLPLRIPIVISVLTLVLYLVSTKYPHKFRRWPPEVWLFGAMVIGIALSSMHATWNAAASWEMALFYLKTWVFFLLLIQMLNSRARLDGFHWTLILSVAWLVFCAWSLRGTTGARFENVGGADVHDCNEYSAALVLLFPFVYQRTFSERRVVAWGAAVLCFGIPMAVMIADSRGGFLGLVALSLAIIFLLKRRRLRNIALMIILGALVFHFAKWAQIERIETIIADTHQSTRDGSAQLRLDYWKLAWHLFLQHPLLGIGYNNFWYYSGYMVDGLPYGQHGQVTHSLWMEVLSGGGLAVAVPFLLLLGRFFWSTLRLARKLTRAGRHDVALYFYTPVLGMIGFLVSASFVDRMIYEPIYWCIALGVANRYIWAEDVKAVSSQRVPKASRPRGIESTPVPLGQAARRNAGAL